MLLERSSEKQLFEVMIISRGRGRGHAMPDIAIASDLWKLIPDVRLQFVSYATGAETYRAFGYEVLDLELPDNPPFLDALIVFARLLERARPHFVIAHEEIAALAAAQIFQIPCVFIVDFFSDPTSVASQLLRYATEVVFTGKAGLYTEPPYLKGRIHYVGRTVRRFEYTMADRARARDELDIAPEATVILCQPGSWPEARLPLAELLAKAWKLLPMRCKQLIWLAGQDYEGLSERFRDSNEITLLQYDWKIDRLMAASDLLITKANRVTVYEAAHIGLPSISISALINWPDDVAVSNVKSNTALMLDDTSPRSLAELIIEKINTKFTEEQDSFGGVAKAAERIAHHIGLARELRCPLS